MITFTTEITVINHSYRKVDTDFTVDFSGGTRRGRRVPFAYPLNQEVRIKLGFSRLVQWREAEFTKSK